MSPYCSAFTASYDSPEEYEEVDCGCMEQIREEDRYLTTFLTPWGRYRHKTDSQGYTVSGDAYTARYDRITEGVDKMRRVIDDTLLYEDNIEKSYRQVAAYLSLVGQNGIILNPDKFEFAEDEVSWAGVRISKEKVAPLQDHVSAIRQFPTPTNITDLRSYFALVNQVAPYYAVQPELLKKECSLLLGRGASEIV